MGSRAAVFTQQPQDVEVYADGAWWPGSILGWRHDSGDSCQVWVRATVAGVVRSTWTELPALRLPEPRLGVAPEPPAARAIPAAAAGEPGSGFDGGAARRWLVEDVLGAPELVPDPDRAPGRRRGRRWRHGVDLTAEPPVVRPGRTAGRHRAPAADESPRAVEDHPVDRDRSTGIG